MSTQKISDRNGLTEITLDGFARSCGPMDISALNRLSDYSTGLNKLTLSNMQHLKYEDRQSLVNMLILIVQSNPPLTYLNLHNFESMSNNDTLVGEQVMELLCGS